MNISIPLPNSFSISSYKDLKNYLKQLELAVHYAQKSVEHAEKEGIEVTESAYVSFKHPGIDANFVDENYDELQSVELEISLQ